MSAEETLVVDDQAASIWHVDRTARVTQLISGDPKDPARSFSCATMGATRISSRSRG